MVGGWRGSRVEIKCSIGVALRSPFLATVPPALTIPTGSRRAVSVGFSVGCASEVPAAGVFVCRLGSPGN